MLGRKQAGDTLVEVLIATAILSLAMAGALTAMSYGQGIALRSVERTEVQGLLNSQLSYLRYARDQAIANDPALWDAIKLKATSSVPASGSVCNGTRPVYTNSSMFYIQESTAAVPTPSVVGYPMSSPGVPTAASGTPTPGSGIWIDAVKGGTVPNPEYIDFYVKACWSPASGTVAQESRTVMRLYVPE